MTDSSGPPTPAAIGVGISRAPAVTRAAALLKELAASGSNPIGVSELARKLGIPKSSALNLCSALVDAGLCRRRNGGFVLGTGVMEISATYLSTVDVVNEFQAAYAESGELTREIVQLALLGPGLNAIYVARHPGSRPMRLAAEIGGYLPANCTATGMAMLAQLSAQELAARLPASGQLETLTPRSIATAEGLKQRLKQAWEQGYAVDDEETVAGTVCVAAAFWPSSATAFRGPAAISVTMHKADATPEHVAQLAEQVKNLTRQVGMAVGAALSRH